MSKFRKVDPKIWNDKKFNALSDKAKLVFFLILTHPHLTALGAMRGSIKGLAFDLKMNEKAFREAFREAFRASLIKYDEESSFIWLPNFLKYNRPQSPNVVLSWSNWLNYLPECDLKIELIHNVKSFVQSLGEAFREALPEGFRKPSESLTETMSMRNENENENEKKHSCEIAGALSREGMFNNSTVTTSKDVVQIFDYWREVFNHANAKLDNARKSKIRSALKLFSVEECCEAIDGCKASAYHQGENEMKKKFDGIDLIFRNAEKIEWFKDLSKTQRENEDPGFGGI